MELHIFLAVLVAALLHASWNLLVKLDLDFQRLNVAMAKSTPGAAKAPWSNATIDINGLNYIDVQARISAAQLNLGDTQFAPAAIEANLASGVMKLRVANLGTYGGLANGDLTIDASTAVPSYTLQTDLSGVRALSKLRFAATPLVRAVRSDLAVAVDPDQSSPWDSGRAGTAFVIHTIPTAAAGTSAKPAA